MTDLVQIISRVLQIDAKGITPELAINEIPTWNSLSHIELVVSIEEEYHLELTGDEIAAMTSVDKIRRTLSLRGVITE